MLDVRQSINLLKQDKEYLTKQLSELKPRHDFLQQKLEETTKQLDDVRKAREELYEKYIHSRWGLENIIVVTSIDIQLI